MFPDGKDPGTWCLQDCRTDGPGVIDNESQEKGQACLIFRNGPMHAN